MSFVCSLTLDLVPLFCHPLPVMPDNPSVETESTDSPTSPASVPPNGSNTSAAPPAITRHPGQFIPWKPGQSGNPKGRPKKRPQSEAYSRLVRSEIPHELIPILNRIVVRDQPKSMKLLEPGDTWAEAIGIGLMKKAIAGDVPAAKELRESIEGKSTQRVEIMNPQDRRQHVEISFRQAEINNPSAIRASETTVTLTEENADAETAIAVNAALSHDDESPE